jgi:hypothetical protein
LRKRQTRKRRLQKRLGRRFGGVGARDYGQISI